MYEQWSACKRGGEREREREREREKENENRIGKIEKQRYKELQNEYNGVNEWCLAAYHNQLDHARDDVGSKK